MQKIILVILCILGIVAGTFFASLFATDFFYFIREKILQKTFQQAIKLNAYFFYNDKRIMEMKKELIDQLHHASIIGYKKDTLKFLEKFEELQCTQETMKK